MSGRWKKEQNQMESHAGTSLLVKLYWAGWCQISVINRWKFSNFQTMTDISCWEMIFKAFFFKKNCFLKAEGFNIFHLVLPFLNFETNTETELNFSEVKQITTCSISLELLTKMNLDKKSYIGSQKNIWIKINIKMDLHVYIWLNIFLYLS